MALAGAFLLGEGGAPAVLLFRIPHSRLHQLRVNECNRDVTPTILLRRCQLHGFH
jgi:hypothetical protein